MSLYFSKQTAKGYQRLPVKIQHKADKQFVLLLADYRHPSLRARKMGEENKFEARIDIKYRFTFLLEGDDTYILTVGPHDVGLGKK